MTTRPLLAVAWLMSVLGACGLGVAFDTATTRCPAPLVFSVPAPAPSCTTSYDDLYAVRHMAGEIDRCMANLQACERDAGCREVCR